MKSPVGVLGRYPQIKTGTYDWVVVTVTSNNPKKNAIQGNGLLIGPFFLKRIIHTREIAMEIKITCHILHEKGHEWN